MRVRMYCTKGTKLTSAMRRSGVVALGVKNVSLSIPEACAASSKDAVVGVDGGE